MSRMMRRREKKKKQVGREKRGNKDKGRSSKMQKQNNSSDLLALMAVPMPPMKKLNFRSTTTTTTEKEEANTNTKISERELFDNWVPLPPPLQMVQTDFEHEQDWLFKKKNVSNKTNDGSSIQIQPRAQYLPDADIYALPYTIPY